MAGMMPVARPSSSAGRYQLAQMRNFPTTTNQNSARTPSPVPTTVPLHVMTVGPSRPRTPTEKRRVSNGPMPKPGQATSFELLNPQNQWNMTAGGAAASNGPPRPDSSMGQQGSSNSAQAGSLTTVISSALDYKRFLDKRKLMIQQQVETAQQATHSIGDVREQSKACSSSDCAGAREEYCGADVPTAIGCGSSGVSGPVRASHTVATGAATLASVAAPAVGADGPPSDYVSSSADQASDVYDRTSLPPGVSSKQEQAAFLAKHCRVTSSGGISTQELPEELNITPRSASSVGMTTPQNLFRSHLIASANRAQTSEGLGASSVPCAGGEKNNNDPLQRGIASRPSAPPAVVRPASRTGLRDTTLQQQTAAESGTDHDIAQRRPKCESSLGEFLGETNDTRWTSSSLAGNSLDDYIIGKQVGAGAYATVRFGLHKETGKKVAIKVYEKFKLLDPQRRKSVRCEIRLMERLRHPNIVVFHDALDTPKQIYIIMDFAGGGSLHHLLKKRTGRRLDEMQAKRVFFQVGQGINYLHERHIVHRDVKLENLLLDESGTVKIIDFGFSTILPPGKKLKIFCGTPSYMSPEIVARKEYSGFCADIWAMGVLLYALLCGTFPFKAQNDRDLYRKIVRGVFHIPDHVGEMTRSLLNRILTPDMSRRMTVDDVLNDVWFSSHKDDLYSSMGKHCSSTYQPNCSISSTATTAAPSSSAGQSARDSDLASTLAATRRSGNGDSHAPRGASTCTISGVSGAQACASTVSTPLPIARPESAVRDAMLPPPIELQSIDGLEGGGADYGSGSVARRQSVSPVHGHAALRDVAVQRAEAARAGATAAAAMTVGSNVRMEDDPVGSLTDKILAVPTSSRGGQTSDVLSQDRSVGAAPDQPRGTRLAGGIEEEAIQKLERLGYPRDEIVRQLRDEGSHLYKLYFRFLKALTAWDKK